VRHVAPLGLLILVLAFATSVHPDAYLKLGASVGGDIVELRWPDGPVRYFVTDRGTPGVSALEFSAAVDRAVDTWEDVGTASVEFEFVGLTGAEPADEDGIVTIGFQSRPDLQGILGSTSFVVDVTTGEIVEADILINAAFPWSVEEAGDSGRFDVESVVLHEIGHLVGLGHSLLGETELALSRRRVIAAESALFPIAFGPGVVEGRTLRADDIAGVSDLYSTNGFTARTGSIDGRVVRDGVGVFGAHVVAFNTRTGALVGGFTLTDEGEFVVGGLDPGPYLVRVEPLDDADPESFFHDESPPDTDFLVTYHERLVFVGAGGGAGPVEISVRSP
jgi:hypothetical protein